jgi:hypothetical protein
MDSDTFVGESAAPFERVRDFYVRCLDSRASGGEHQARFERQLDGPWTPAVARSGLLSPRDMRDEIVVKDLGDGTTSIQFRLSYPYGRGKARQVVDEPERANR